MHKQERSENNEKRGVYLNGMNKWGKEEEGPLCKKKKKEGGRRAQQERKKKEKRTKQERRQRARRGYEVESICI